MATGFDECTTALSIYNAVSFAGRDLTLEEVTDFLRRAWDARFDVEDLDEGLAYLVKRKWVTNDGAIIGMTWRNPTTGHGPAVQRDVGGNELIRIERF